jgi:hypothetical protein
MALRGHSTQLAPVEPTIRFLITMCGQCQLALRAEWIRGILTQEEAGYGPTVSSGGVAYPLAGLADRLQIQSGGNSADTRLILCGNGTYGRALIVDRVVELIDVDRAAPRPLPSQFRGSERIKLSGYLLYEDAMVLIVDPVWLLETDIRMDAPRSHMVQRHEAPELPHAHVPEAQSVVGPRR